MLRPFLILELVRLIKIWPCAWKKRPLLFILALRVFKKWKRIPYIILDLSFSLFSLNLYSYPSKWPIWVCADLLSGFLEILLVQAHWVVFVDIKRFWSYKGCFSRWGVFTTFNKFTDWIVVQVREKLSFKNTLLFKHNNGLPLLKTFDFHSSETL